MKRLMALLLALGLMLGLTPALAEGKAFSFGGALDDMDLIDVHKATSSGVLQGGIMVCEPLLALQPDGSLAPQLLAEMPAVSEDGKVFTCKLREDVYFHDGTQLTSKDVYFTLHRIFDPATANVNAWLCDMILGGKDMLDGKATELAGVTIQDDFNFTIELEYPYAPFNYILSCPQMLIYPQDACTAAGETWGIDSFVGTGPFVFESFTAKDTLHLVANEKYYEGRPQIDEVYLYNLDRGTALMEFEAGSLDLVNMDPTYVKGYQEGEFAKNLVMSDLRGIIALNLNVAMPPLDNVKVREAVAHAIDQKAIVESYLQGNGTVANSLITPSVAGYTDRPSFYDPEKAKALLAEAGFPDGIKLVNYVSETSSIAGIPVVLQEQLKASNIELEVNRVDSATYVSLRKEGSVQCPLLTWYADMPDPDNFTYTFFQSGNSKFFSSNWNDPLTDELMAKGRAMPAGEERIEIYKQIDQRLVAEEFVTVPLYNPVTYYLKSDKVEGIFFDGSMFHLDDASIVE